MKPTNETVKCDAARMLPLRVVSDPDGDGAQFHIYTRPDETPGNLNNFAVAEVYNQDDATFIVTACNAHEVLLDACKLVERAWAGDGVQMSQAVDACLLAISQATNT